MKKILMLAPFFFGYELKIKNELEKKGYFIKLYNDYSSYKPKLSLKDKMICKILRQKRKILEIKKNEYFQGILRNEEVEKYDIIFVIKGENIPQWFYQELKKRNTNSEWISYQWDDIQNCPRVLNTKKYFDKNFTYSENDAKVYDYVYRPFFFVYDIEATKKGDVFFIGTSHSDREKVLIQILRELNKIPKLKINCNLLIKKWKYIKKMKWLKKEKIYITKEIKYEDVIKKMAEYKIAIEIPHEKQLTTTTRSIEAIGTRTKIITTVKEVKKKEFYNENNYLIIDRNKPAIEKEWLEKPYKDLDKSVKDKYTLLKWIEDIFEKR